MFAIGADESSSMVIYIELVHRSEFAIVNMVTSLQPITEETRVSKSKWIAIVQLRASRLG